MKTRVAVDVSKNEYYNIYRAVYIMYYKILKKYI